MAAGPSPARPAGDRAAADGTRRYRFTADVGRYPDGKRRQQRFTFATKKAAQAELARITHQRADGTLTPRWNGTVADLCDEYLRSATFGREANTAESYAHALKSARARLGPMRASAVTRQDIEDLRDWMLSQGRRRGGRPGTGLGARSVRLAIGRLSAAFEQAIEDGKLARNPCRRVGLPKLERRDERWSDEELRAFLAAADSDRLAAAWRLSVYGLRRAEVCGLRWADDVDLDAGTVTVTVTRPVINGHPIVKAPKSGRGGRTLPLDGQLVTMLRALHTRQAAEKLAAGEAYEASGYVVCDELGGEVNPEWYSDEFHRVRERAGARRIRLHDERRTINSLMAAAGSRTTSGPPGAGTPPSTSRPTPRRGRRSWPPPAPPSARSSGLCDRNVTNDLHRPPGGRPGRALACGNCVGTAGFEPATP